MKRWFNKRNGNEPPLQIAIGLDATQKMVVMKFNRKLESVSFDLEAAFKVHEVLGMNIRGLAALHIEGAPTEGGRKQG